MKKLLIVIGALVVAPTTAAFLVYVVDEYKHRRRVANKNS